MKILEFMSFNPGWFLTLPGILITSGVILLLIALILLLTSAKKEEEEENVSPVNSFTTPNVETPVAPEPVQINVPQAPAQEEIKPIIAEQPTIQPAQSNAEPQIAQHSPMTSNIGAGILDIANNNTKPVVEEVAMPTKTETPGVLNIGESIVPEQTQSEEIASININNVVPPAETPVINPTPVVNATPVVPQAPVQEEVKPVITTEPVQPVSIYGGVSPTIDIKKENLQQEKAVIYGGADPLENTAPIPTVAHPAYSTVIPTPQPVTPKVNEAKLVDPIATPEVVEEAAIVDTTTNDTIPATPHITQDVETLEL